MTDLDALDRMVAEAEAAPILWTSRAAFLWNAYPALAAELREARRRVCELESEIEVRDNSANIVFDTLKAALPNRGFHSEMEAAEAARKEIAELRQQLDVHSQALSHIYWKALPIGDDRGNSDIADIAGDALKGNTSPLAALDDLRRKLIGEESDRWITALRKLDLGLCDFIDEGDIEARLAEWLDDLRRRDRSIGAEGELRRLAVYFLDRADAIAAERAGEGGAA
jgi:hypothetical protein